MILRSVCWSIFLCLALRPGVKAQVQVEEQSYKNVLISFAPNVPSDDGKSYVQGLRELLENTSSVLHTAIGIRIATVTFLLPKSWDSRAWENVDVNSVSSEQTDRKPDILVDATQQSPFGKQPVTLQHGGCGVAGHQITLPVDFLSSTEEYSKGKLLAKEWLKYRYGVFDENGFEKDSLYPDYYRVPGRSEIHISECTNSEVTYAFKNTDGETCNMNTTEEFDNCKFHPDEESAVNVTSSLMYFHKELPNMEHVCGKDHPHQKDTRNKHNVLCNGRSIWDVLNSSKDFKNIPDEPAQYEPIQFSFIQESRPSFVVLLENSDKFAAKETPLKFALRRFYYDLPAFSKLAILTYNNNLTGTFLYQEIPAQERSELTLLGVDFGYSEEAICTSCGLSMASQILLLKSEIEKGTILLITASPLDDVPEFPAELKGSGISLNVLRLVDENADDETYKDLTNSFDSFSYHTISAGLNDMESFDSFFSFLKTADIETLTFASETISGETSVTIPKYPIASLYTLWLAKSLTSSSIQCKDGADTVMVPTPATKASDIASFNFDPPVVGDITCKLGSSRVLPVLVQARLLPEKERNFNFESWIHDTSTETEQMPIIIYAKVYFGGYPIKGANATALITTADNVEETIQMLDNGRGDPDITQHDGIYSGYFTGFSAPGYYKILVEMNDDEGRAKIGKHVASSPTKLGSDSCCGSQVVSEDHDVPNFALKVLSDYTAKGKRPDDGYKPSRIVDLQVGAFNPPDNVKLTWTAPSGEKASSYEFYAFCDSENCNEDGRLPQWLTFNQSQPKPKPNGEPEEVELLFAPESPTIENLTMLFAIKSATSLGKASDLSNKAEIFLSMSTQPLTSPAPVTDDDRKLSSSDTIGIIVGSSLVAVFLLICLAAVLYLYVFKPRRDAKLSSTDANANFQGKDQPGTEDSGSFREVPIRRRGSSSMRRVESFPVLLYTHDQIKGHKKKVDPPLYKPAIAARPWMSMNVLSNSEQSKGGDSKSIGSASTLPMHDKHRSAEMKQMDDISLKSDAPHSEETIKL